MPTVLTFLAICILSLGFTCIVILQHRRIEHEHNPYLHDDIDQLIDDVATRVYHTKRTLYRILHGEPEVMEYRRRWDE